MDICHSIGCFIAGRISQLYIDTAGSILKSKLRPYIMVCYSRGCLNTGRNSQLPIDTKIAIKSVTARVCISEEIVPIERDPKSEFEFRLN